MITFEVNDMTCGHCASTITRAVKDQDKDARVHIDLAAHQVAIESKTADLQDLSDAITEAGYTPVAAPNSIRMSAGQIAESLTRLSPAPGQTPEPDPAAGR